MYNAADSQLVKLVSNFCPRDLLYLGPRDVNAYSTKGAETCPTGPSGLNTCSHSRSPVPSGLGRQTELAGVLDTDSSHNLFFGFSYMSIHKLCNVTGNCGIQSHSTEHTAERERKSSLRKIFKTLRLKLLMRVLKLRLVKTLQQCKAYMEGVPNRALLKGCPKTCVRYMSGCNG